jgi:2-amino-1-hydroxyethylphosphonate dioxygenase (glycine-forming)
MIRERVDEIANEIIGLYEQFGKETYAGEKVSQAQHMWQAAQLAEQQGYDDEVILAAFLHDIGHLLPAEYRQQGLMGEYGVMSHEKVGSDFLFDKGFSYKLCRLVASHVSAKRYLTYKQPWYYEQLSEASKKTLEFQGGKMTEAEALAFEADPLFELYIYMRQWDEAAKEEAIAVPDLLEFKQKIAAHLIQQLVL